MDVSITSPRDKNPALSQLMTVKARLKVGEALNACPFGCETEDLDEGGKCRHLIGYTNDTPEMFKRGQGTYEPLVQDGDQRRVAMRRERRESRDAAGKKVMIDGPPIPEKGRPSDVLVRITISYRVYRNVDAEPKVKQGD